MNRGQHPMRAANEDRPAQVAGCEGAMGRYQRCAARIEKERVDASKPVRHVSRQPRIASDSAPPRQCSSSQGEQLAGSRSAAAVSRQRIAVFTIAPPEPVPFRNSCIDSQESLDHAPMLRQPPVSMRILICCLALSASPAAGSPNSLTPEATFDLYARAALEDDEDALRELSASGQGLNLPYPSEMLASELIRSVPHRAFERDGNAEEAAEAWAAAVLHNTKCRATSSQVWHRIETGYRVADVRFSCKVPDVKRLRNLYDAAFITEQESTSNRFWSAYRTLLESGPFRHAHGTARLVAAPGSTIWRSEPYSGVRFGRVFDNQVAAEIGKLLDRAWSTTYISDSTDRLSYLNQRTLIRECDELVDGYRHCAALLAPQELTGASDLAKHLNRLKKQLPEHELAEDCRALGRDLRATWSDACDGKSCPAACQATRWDE